MSSSRTARAGVQAISGTAGRMVIQVLNLVVLARLLAPAEFGVYAMAMTVVGFASLFRDLGLSTAAVQADTLSSQVRSNLWWINTLIGGFLAVVTAAVAPLAARFYGQPDVAVMLWLMAPTLLLAGATAQYTATLMRSMRFGVIAAAETTGAILGLILAVTLAASGAGIWALAVPQVAAGVLVLAVAARAAGWAPGLPHRGHGTRRLFRFGASVFAAQTLTYVHKNADAVLLGRLHGADVTGLYNRATQMTRMPISMLAGPFSQVALASMAPHQNDAAELLRLARKGQVLLALPILTTAGFLIAAADPIVTLALGPGWDAAVPFVRIIAASEALALMASVGGWIITAKGLPRLLIRLSMISTVVKLTAVGVGTIWGPHGIVAGVLLSQLILWPTSLTLAGRFTGLRTGILIAHSYVFVGAIGASCAAGWFAGTAATAFGPVVQVLAAGAGMLGLLAVVFVVLPVFRTAVTEFVGTVRSGVR